MIHQCLQISQQRINYGSFPQQSTVKLLMVYLCMQTNLWLTLSAFEFWSQMTHSYSAIFYRHTMIAPWERTVAEMQPIMHCHVTFIRTTSPSISRTGLDGVLIVFRFNPHSLCKSVCTSILSTPFVLIMLVHCQHHLQEINGS